MKYVDFIKIGLAKMDKRPTQKDMADAMGLKKAAITQRLNNRPDSTNKTAKEVFQLMALAGWRAVIFDGDGEIVMGTAHVDSVEGMEKQFIKRCEELSRENEELKVTIETLRANQAKSVPTVESTDVTADVTPRVRRNPKPQLFTIADLKLVLKDQNGVFEGSLNQLGDLLAVQWCDIESRTEETLKPSKVVVCRLLKAAVEAGVVQVGADKPQGPKTIVLL